MHDLEDIFGPHGPLKRSLPDFRFRRQQLRMAMRVAEALERREALVVEAGTGTGKTFAYLVPALLSGARVLISTGTRTLQDQLFAKDLPLLAAALGRPARVSLLKGRANYVCRHRLNTAVEQLSMEPSGRREPLLAKIDRWSRTTRTGDLAEVPGLSDSHALWSQITSTRDNCLGQRCGAYSQCHVLLARRAAQEADIVVVNHHLLLADLALKEDGFGDILGSADAVILDEAHQIPDLATQFFGVSVSSRRIENMLKEARQELARELREEGSAAAAAVELLREVEEHAAKLGAKLPRGPGRFAWHEASAEVDSLVRELAGSLEEFSATLGAGSLNAVLANVAGRAGELALALEQIGGAGALEGTRTIECTARGFSLSLLPFDVSERFRALMQSRRSAWIFTSATLSLGEDFSHFTGRLGLEDASTLKIDSPFDYEQQSLLYLPAGLPEPSDAAFVPAVIDLSVPLIEASRGGAFLLFTSHRALERGAELIRERWGAQPPWPIYVQGEAPRERLLEAFRLDGSGVLLGTASFWEGVDVKGEALRLVIIEKLPFASPDDPVVKARIDYLNAGGGNAFRDYQLPEAALALKQGVGRLIRSEEDYGVVVICDPRILARHYGRVFLKALPPMSGTRDRDEVLRFLQRHAPQQAVLQAAAAPAGGAA